MKSFLSLWESHANDPEIKTNDEIVDYVQSIHRREDWGDTDITERIEAFPWYRLTDVPIDQIETEEFEYDEDYVDQEAHRIKTEGHYDPIVVVHNDNFTPPYNIVDGTHRVNAVKRLGRPTIRAWVGITNRMKKSLTESHDVVYYHVTPATSIDRILHEGLVPRQDKRSAEANEREPGVYMFGSRVDAEDAVANWLGEQFDEDEPLALLQIKLPKDFPRPKKTAFEYMSTIKIPPAFITVASRAI